MQASPIIKIFIFKNRNTSAFKFLNKNYEALIQLYTVLILVFI